MCVTCRLLVGAKTNRGVRFERVIRDLAGISLPGQDPTRRRRDAYRASVVRDGCGRVSVSCGDPPDTFLVSAPALAVAGDGPVEPGIKLGAVVAVHAIAMGLKYFVGRLPTSGASVKWHIRNLLFLSLRADALQVGSCKRVPDMRFGDE